ncbi:recombinase family protein [Ancylomarina sp. DW003]|nr:recombinase family protein [Ancylomarina sp. DW003]MDE5421750.1 recombinase family protein [Ancylomarina sp. DW003]
MEKKIYKYTRVSTEEQNEARQVDGLQDYKGELLIDKISGKIQFAKRPQAKMIIEAVNEGLISELIVFDVDRLGRDTLDILETLKILKTNKVCVNVHKLGIKSFIDGKFNPAFELITTVMATLAQMEVERSRQNQLEGIAAERKKDEKREFKDKAYKGRKLGAKNKDSISLVKKYLSVKACLESGMSTNKIVVATGVSKSTVKRVRAEYFKSENKEK